jgi:hypothetical protein
VSIARFAIILLQSWLLGRGAHGIPYSEFAQHLTDTQLQEVDVRQGYLEGKLQNPLPDGGDRVITTGVDPQLADRLSQAKAADIAGNMVTRYGMSDHLGQMTYEQQRQSFLGQAQFTAQERQYSEEAARKIDCAVRELTEKARQQALHILADVPHGTGRKCGLATGERDPARRRTAETGSQPAGEGQTTGVGQLMAGHRWSSTSTVRCQIESVGNGNDDTAWAGSTRSQ